ncbi:progranulin [Trichonephila clavata]|uniref:Progranulin n=1 Tax=Trichonephila clavata TaxID=2740835 RepID=A0A8X6H6Y5_TRICU|nr:progranulin [Trichonephila clavata]
MRIFIAAVLSLQLCVVLGKNICPDQTGYCHDDQTCCPGEEEYQCCPFVDAVCCSDKKHCCPANNTCNIQEGMCYDNAEASPSIPLGRKTEIFNLQTELKRASKIKTVQCDTEVYCDDGSSCCPLASGEYACCDYPAAVCCPDKLHCCPHGSVCDDSGFCVYGNNPISLYILKMIASVKHQKPKSVSKKMKSMEMTEASKIEIVPCDEKSFCLDGNTCCPLASGAYGCCKWPSAVCCPDKRSCCPHGSLCDGIGNCVSSGVLPDFLKQPIISLV